MIGPDGNTLVPFGYMFFHCLFGARICGPDAVGGADGQKGTLLSRDGSFRSGLPTAAQRFVEPYQSKVLVSHGVNRVSVNPQTMSDAVLEEIGRHHTAAQVREAVAMVKKFPQLAFNMDLIAGLPGDTPESFSDTVREVIALGAENITVHTLALKKGSRFLTEGTALPDGKAVGEMLGDAREKLEAAGYAPYYLYRQKFMSGSFENVGWTKPGYENLYNICIMEELCGILAVGAGGSTKLTAPGGVVKRLMAPKYPREYMDRIAHTCAEKDEIVRFYNSEPKGTN